MTHMNFAEKLAALLGREGWSQARLVRVTGLRQSAVSEMVSGKRRPYLDQAHLIARALGVTLDYLADDARVDAEPAPELDAEAFAVAMLFDSLREDAGLTSREAFRRLRGAPSAAGTGTGESHRGGAKPT